MPNIKGTWQWLDNPALEVPETIDQTVSFNSNGESFERMEVRGFIRYYYAGQHTPEYVDVTATGETWAESSYKYVDFGETEQDVSDDFYTYFMANAFPYTEIQLGSVYPITLLTKGSYLDKNIRVLPSPTQEPTLEQKTVTPTTSEQVVTPSQGYDALSQVTVRAVPTEKKTVTPTESQQTVTPSEGKFLSDVTVQAIQATEEDIVENGEYTPESGKYYKKVNVNVPQYTDISSTTAQPDDVLEGKYFFPYNNAPRTEGTIPIQTPSNVQFTSKTDSVTFQEGYYPEASTVKIAESEKAKIIPDNIKEGISILGVQGNYAGNGLDINGAINEYVVNAGATVNAGDFVEFIQGIVNQGTFNSGDTNYTSAAALSNNQALVAYRDSGNSGYGTAVVLTISGTKISVGNKTVFNNGSTNYISAVALNNSQVLVAYNNGGNSNYGTAVVLTINGTTINVGTETVFNNGTTANISAVALSDSQVLVAYSDGGNSYYGTAVVLTISGTTIRVGNKTVFDNRNTGFISAVALSNSRALIAYRHNGSPYYGTAVVLTISGTTISAGTETVFNSGSTGYISAVALNNSQVLVAYSDGGNSGYGTAVVLTINGTTINVGTETVFNNGSTNYISAVALNNSQVLVAYSDGGNSNYGTAVVLTVSGTTISVGNKTIFNNGNISNVSAVAVDENNVLITYRNSGDSLGDYALIGEVIQPATTRDGYVGVAKTSGAAGQTVEVFEVPFSYTVTVTKTNCTNTAVTSPMKQSETQTITFTANTAYELPENITVTNCEYTWNNLTGELTITNLTGNVQITVNATVQKLAAPVIALNGSVVSWNAVPHATSYGIFANNTPFGASTAATSVDLSQYEKAMGAGVKSITVNAQGSPYATSDMSNAVSYTVTPLAAPSVTFVPTTGQLVWAAIDGADSYTVYEQTSSSQWQEVTTTTATYATIDYSVGTHTMAVAATSTTKVDSDRSAAVTVVCRGINLTLSNVTGASSNPTKMFEGTTETLTFTANSGYTLPDAVSITGATVSWNKDTGTLTLSNPTSNITGTITGVATQTGYTVTVYNGNEPNRTISVTINGQTIKPGTNYTFTNITELVFDDSNAGSDITVKMDATSTTWGVGDYTWTDGFPRTITIDHDGNVAVWAEVF